MALFEVQGDHLAKVLDTQEYKSEDQTGGDRTVQQSSTLLAFLDGSLEEIVLGATGCYYWFVRDLNQVNERLDSIQQQLMPAPVAKPTTGPSAKSSSR